MSWPCPLKSCTNQFFTVQFIGKLLVYFILYSPSAALLPFRYTSFWKLNKWRLPYHIYWTKKINALKIERSFCKSTWLARFSSCGVEVIKRKRQTLYRVLNTEFLTNSIGEFWYLSWFVFYARLNFGVRKHIAPIPSSVYNARKNKKNQKRRHGFWATLYRNILFKFELKWLKISCTQTSSVRPISWKYTLL